MDHYYLHKISIVFVLFGTFFMLISIFISLKIKEIVTSEARLQWIVITSFMISFLLGYSLFLFLQLRKVENFFELIAAVLFLGGALFVFLVMLLIQKTLTLMNKTSQALEGKVIEHKQVSEELRQSRATLENIFNNAIPLCITNKNYEIVKANEAYYDIFGRSAQQVAGQKCFDSRPGESCNSRECPLNRIMDGEKEVVCDTIKQEDNGRRKHFIVTARPFLDANKELVGIVESFQDISERKRAEDAKEDLIKELQNALEEVNLLSGCLPICASCKNVRDDKGYWNQVEQYISEHSAVTFSHGICPECAKKLYPEQYYKLHPKEKKMEE